MERLYDNSTEFFINRIKAKNVSMGYLQAHNYYELYYLTEGSRKYFINDTVYSVEEGDVLIIPPGLLHRSIGDNPGKHSRVLINIMCNMFDEEFKSEYDDCIKNYFVMVPNKRKRYFDELIEKIESEYTNKDNFSKKLINNYINEMMMFFVRASKMEDAQYIGNETDEVIGNAAKYICMNYGKDISLEEVARAVGMSKTYFSKIFKTKTGSGFSDYLTSVRVTEASKLIVNTDLSITEVAVRCGFNDSSYFSSVFKSLKGITPYKYRKSVKL
ncbi:MAG: AraC family transcriptional regulator [Bacillota bacterium]|nr:AraC family transcriptional regulator [Bacillota bacterium]